MKARLTLSLLISTLCFVFIDSAVAEKVRIGALFSLSSWGANGGYQELNAAKLAVEKINADGGVLGKQLELVVEDNHSDLKTTASAFIKLAEVDKVPVILGPNWAEFSEIAVPLSKRVEVPMLSPSGYKKDLFGKSSFAFTLWPRHEVATQPLADLLQSRGVKRLYALVSDNAYYHEILLALSSQLSRVGVKIVKTESFGEGVFDYRSVISRMKASKDLDGVIALLLESGEFSSFLEQSKQLSLSQQIYSANGIDYSEKLKKNPSSAEGLVYFTYLVPGGDQFLEEYKAKYSSLPGFGSSRAFDAVYIIKAAIEKCGLDAEKIRDCLSQTDYKGLTGDITFTRSGEYATDSPSSKLMMVKDNQFRPFTGG